MVRVRMALHQGATSEETWNSSPRREGEADGQVKDGTTNQHSVYPRPVGRAHTVSFGFRPFGWPLTETEASDRALAGPAETRLSRMNPDQAECA